MSKNLTIINPQTLRHGYNFDDLVIIRISKIFTIFKHFWESWNYEFLFFCSLFILDNNK